MRTIGGFLLLVPCLCWAGSIGSDATINEVYGTGPTTVCVTGFLTTTGATCSGSTGVGGTSATVNYDAYGLATYGSLGAYATGSITPGTATSGSIPAYINIASVGYFTDSFTINAIDECGPSPCPASGSGTIELQFLVDGTGSGPYGACMSYQLGSSPNGLNCTPIANEFFANAGLATSGPIAITFGQPTTLTIGLIAFGHISDYTDTSGGFTVDLSHTASLGGFVVDDSVGNQLSNFTVTSGSGTSYPDTTLPEPSTAALMTLGLIAMLAAGKRVSNRSRVLN